MTDDELIEKISNELYYPNANSVIAKRKANKIAELCKAHFKIKVETALKQQAQGLYVSEYVKAANKAFE